MLNSPGATLIGLAIVGACCLVVHRGFATPKPKKK